MARSPSPTSSDTAVSSPHNAKPSLIASFPAHAAPPHPTALLTPFATGSSSELFRCVVKRPAPIHFEINGEHHSNAPDVALQFAAELRVYTTVTRHLNIPAFMGAIEGLGLVLEHIEGRTLLDRVRECAPDRAPSLPTKVRWANQLLDGIAHLHSFGLSHGDLSLLNIHVTERSGTLKIFDFGRSVRLFDPNDNDDSLELDLDDDFVDLPRAAHDDTPDPPRFNPRAAFPFPAHPHHGGGLVTTDAPGVTFPMIRNNSGPQRRSRSQTRQPPLRTPLMSPRSSSPAVVAPPPRKKQKRKLRLSAKEREQVHPGTRPFSAPEIMRGECEDPLLADAYSVGMVMLCIDAGGLIDVDPVGQREERPNVPDLRGLDGPLAKTIRSFICPHTQRTRVIDAERIESEDSSRPAFD